MEINRLTKRKIKLFMTLMGNLAIAVVISIVVYFILALFFENTLSELVARLNYDLYSWIVYNRDIVVYVYIFTILAVIIYRFISKNVDSINEVYKSLDLILKEDNETIKLPSEVNEFSDKLNGIKYDYMLSKKNAKEAEDKKNDLIMYMAHDRSIDNNIMSVELDFDYKKEIERKTNQKNKERSR